MKKYNRNKNPWSVDRRGIIEGYRSGLELDNAQYLESLGQPVKFEELKIQYTVPERQARYTPDFELANGIIIETKGRFTAQDRAKHVLIKKQHPDLDIRFVFTRSTTRISKVSNTRYRDWCDKNGFQYADKLIPVEWINEVK